MERINSENYFKEALNLFPGGVNSPVRAFKSVNSKPFFVQEAKGCMLYDIDSNEYIDYVCSWGPMILGHSHPEIIQKIKETLDLGMSFGTCSKHEVKLGKLIKKFRPDIEMLRFVNSGTEACMSAVRLARAYTKRKKIIKFSGNYHGHYDSFLVKAGSGVATLGLPDSAGVLENITEQTICIAYNNPEIATETFNKYGDEIACVIVEPVCGNSGCIPPVPDFLETLRNLCTKYNSVLIFDEVITGFRLAKGGASELFKITPDLVTLGKIIGGGLSAGAVGGKKEIMQNLAPEGNVYQAGTLSGNPIAMTAGKITLNLLEQEHEIYKTLKNKTQFLTENIKLLACKYSIPVCVNQCGSMFTVFFTEKNSINNYEDALSCNTKNFAVFFNKLLEAGIFFPPSQFETCFVSFAHEKADINKTINIIEKIFKNF